MSKIALVSLGTIGTVGAGVGSYFWLRSNKIDESFTIRSKYSQALLNEEGDNDLWNKKYEAIKNSSPHNKTLQQAVAKSSGTNKNDEEAKRLLKNGCFEVYGSNYEDANNFSDFKNYCSKTNKDMSTVSSWNNDTAENNSDNKWDKALEALKAHTPETKGKLDSVLEALKKEVSGTKPFDSSIRGKFKKWCEDTNKGVFEGKESIQFKNQEDFCKVIS